MAHYCLGIDIGTSAIKTVIADHNLTAAAETRKELPSAFPQPGWVEQDGEEIYRLVLESISDVLKAAELSPEEIAGIGLDHQGESCIVWDKTTGKPIYPVITWQDRRTSETAEQYKREFGEMIFKTTGQPADSYYSAFKIRWILDHAAPSDQQNLLAGTLNTWIIWKLSGGKCFYTDSASADCTLLYDPQTNDWDEDLLSLFGIPRAMLPCIGPSIGFSPIKTISGIPILATAPDSHAGMYGIGAVSQKTFATTYGTGNFIHFPTGKDLILSENGLTSTVLFSSPTERIYQINGICYTAGSAIKWLINGLNILENEQMASDIAKSVEDSSGVTFVPALSGLASPYWDEAARGAFLGLTAGVRREHLVRAVLDSIAFQTASVAGLMIKTANTHPEAMYALGGMTGNDFLMQFQADMLGIPVLIPEKFEPSYGAAGLAFSALDRCWDSRDCPYKPVIAKQYEPSLEKESRFEKLSAWERSVKQCLSADQ